MNYRKFSALVAASALTAIATPAIAQDDNYANTGLYIEALAGVETLSIDGDEDGFRLEEDESDALYGVALGYDFAIGGLTLGIEAEYSDSSADFDFGLVPVDGIGFERVGTDGDLYFGVKLGVPVSDSASVYLKGGAVQTEVEIESAIPGQGLFSEFEDDGYRIGAGLQFNLSRNLYVKGEYRYSDYGNSLTIVDDGLLTSELDVSLTQSQFVAGVGFKF